MSNKSKRNSNVSQSPDLESIISWLDSKVKYIGAQLILQLINHPNEEIGRASCRERVCSTV